MKRLLITLVFLCTQLGQSQEPLLEIKDFLNNTNRKPSSSYLVENKENSTLTVFIVHKDKIHGYMYKLINGAKQLIGNIKSDKLPKWYDHIAGHTYTNNQIRLVFKHENEVKFASILFDFDKKRSLKNEYDFKLKNQIYIQSYSLNDSYYAFYASKKTNTINVHKFSHNGATNQSNFDLNQDFLDSKGASKNLFQILTDKGPTNSIAIEKIGNSTINSFRKAGKKNKIYERDNGVIITIDKNPNETYVLQMSLPDFKPEIKTFKSPILIGNTKTGYSNSFINGDLLYQVFGNSEYLRYTVINFLENNRISEFSIVKGEPVTLRNSPFIQVGGFLTKYRELEDTKQFLKKSAFGPSIYSINTSYGYEITLGGVLEIETSTPLAGGAGSFGGSVSGNRTELTYFVSKFDQNFNHLKKENRLNVFDKIAIFQKTNKLRKVRKSSFNGQVVFGGYNYQDKTYYVFKFNK